MAADISTVIDVFSAQRLLVLGQNSVEISHDVLLRAWTQLRDWLGGDQLDRALYSQVVTDADMWEVNGRDSSYLYRPGRLATIDAATTRWQDAPTRYPPLPAVSKAFLRAAQHAASRSIRRRRGVIAGLAALTVIAISAAGIAVNYAADAYRQHVISLSRQLAIESLLIDSGDPLTARRLAVAAWRVYPTDQAASVMMTLLIGQQPAGILPGDPSRGGVTGVAFSPNGKLLATAYGDGTVRLWNAAAEQAVGAPLRADTGTASVTGIAFSPNGTLLATAYDDGTVRVWNPRTRHAVGTPFRASTNSVSVTGVAFSPNGKLLATAGGDGTVRVWNAGGGQAPLATYTGNASVTGVAFSPNGKLLATADADGTVRVWNPGGGRAPLATYTGNVPVTGVAFSPDGRLLATADANGTVGLWNTATGHEAGAPFSAETGPGSRVNAVAFSPDGRLLATADADGTVGLWNPATRRAISPPLRTETGPGPGVNAVAFSPDGELLASAGADGTARLWNPATGQAIGPPLPVETRQVSGVRNLSFEPDVTGVAFSPNGKFLATAGADGTVQLWNPATGQAIGLPLAADIGPGGGVNGVAFSSDSKFLATADADGTVRLWNPAIGRAIGRPLPADIGYGVNGVAFSPDGNVLASAGADGNVQTWQVSLFADPYVALCADAGPPTKADWTHYAPGEPQPSACPA